jgi:hypothetical protein
LAAAANETAQVAGEFVQAHGQAALDRQNRLRTALNHPPLVYKESRDRLQALCRGR